ncbi:hypothetical protein [Arthrobacter sp. ISL-30]|uniref:hypothetical protein n=1 Tax=Arthrobacter sp. ISL-30 TaxID=2819109 RepID=UPI001BE558E9|nr:hypothetical protein [Arthrobacter sp. ISL-30]MBT2512559.1 hypothetical protein [Arthrobacter sp. ISL-30]
MALIEEHVVRNCRELLVGDEIEAWHRNRLFHRGRVTNVLPDMGLFWIRDAQTGGRKLLDLGELDIVRVPSRG